VGEGKKAEIRGKGIEIEGPGGKVGRKGMRDGSVKRRGQEGARNHKSTSEESRDGLKKSSNEKRSYFVKKQAYSG
jgi:hypothetical protein